MAFLQGIIVKILLSVFGDLVQKATEYVELRIAEQKLKKDVYKKMEDIYNEKDAKTRAARLADYFNN